MGWNDNRKKTTGAARWPALVCGVAVATGMQLAFPPSALASPLSDWGARASGPSTAIQNAMSSLQSAMGAEDLNGAKAACRRLQDSAQDLKSTLPAPSEALTDEVSAAVSELLTASRSCLSVGQTASQNEINTVSKHLDKAVAHMDNAQAMIAGG
jgi:gas vesicle protein